MTFGCKRFANNIIMYFTMLSVCRFINRNITHTHALTHIHTQNETHHRDTRLPNVCSLIKYPVYIATAHPSWNGQMSLYRNELQFCVFDDVFGVDKSTIATKKKKKKRKHLPQKKKKKTTTKKTKNEFISYLVIVYI